MYLIHCKKSPSLFPSQDVIVIVFLDGKMFPLWSLEFFRKFPFPAQNPFESVIGCKKSQVKK
jgi:hypothetical protein